MLLNRQVQFAPNTMAYAIFRSLLALTISALVGCVAAPVPKVDLTLPEQWQSAAAPALSPPVDLQSWWTIFNAPELSVLVQQTLSENQRLAEAQQHIQSARIISAASNLAFRPDLHARTDDVPSPSSVTTYFRYGFDSTWELGLFGRSESAQRVAKGELGQAEADSRAMRVSIVAEVVKAWVDLRNALQHRELLNQLIAQSQERVSLLQQRASFGLAQPDAMLNARLAEYKAEDLRLEQNYQVKLALQTLATLQGKTTPDPAWEHVSQSAAPSTINLPGLPIDLLRTRPDIQRAQASVLRASGELGLARSELYPHISLSAAYMYSATVTSKFSYGDHLNSAASFGPLIDVPLFDWGRRKAAKNARSALLDAALFSYRDVVIGAYAEAEMALSTLVLQNQRLTHAAEQLLITQQTQQTRRQLATLGLASSLDNLDADNSTVQGRLDQLDIGATRDYAYIGLFKALGGAALNDTLNLAVTGALP